MRRGGLLNAIPLAMLASIGAAAGASPALAAVMKQGAESERFVEDIIFRVVHARECDSVRVDGAAGPVLVELRAADPTSITLDEADDFARRLRAALSSAHAAADAALARLAGPAPHITEAEIDKLSRALGKPREDVLVEMEAMLGRPVTIGEVVPPMLMKCGSELLSDIDKVIEAIRPAQRQAPRQPRKQPVRRVRSERAAKRKAARRARR